MNTPRQTVSYLIRRFRQAGLVPNKRRGQNFLVDLNLVEWLAESAQIDQNDVVLEVGTGTGSLTALLAERAAAVVTVEVDPQLHQLAAETLIDLPQVVMLQQDALQNKNRFHPRVLEAVRQQLDAAPGRQWKLVANLPYSIATPVIANLLGVEPRIASMTVTIQRELAERIVAVPRTKSYSALSVWIQSQCEVQWLRSLPPSVFWPRPQVSSAILHLVPEEAKRARIGDGPFFRRFIQAMFFHRRKLLRRELLSAFKNQLDKPAVAQILRSQGLDDTARAEELDLHAWWNLCDVVRERVVCSSGGETP